MFLSNTFKLGYLKYFTVLINWFVFHFFPTLLNKIGKKKEYWNTNLKYCENSLTSSIFTNYLEITNYLTLKLMQIKWKIHQLLCSASVNLKENICRIIETLRTSILRLCLVFSTKNTSKTKTSMVWINTTAKETKQTKSFQI